MKKVLAISCAAVLSVASFALSAATLTVNFTGPGGHSLRAYGNTSALHAAARAALEVQKALPDAVLSDLNGGNSVNSIAADASFKVTINSTGNELAEKTKLVKQAVQAGVDKENNFRGVKKGDTVKGGTPAEILWSVK